MSFSQIFVLVSLIIISIFYGLRLLSTGIIGIIKKRPIIIAGKNKWVDAILFPFIVYFLLFASNGFNLFETNDRTYPLYSILIVILGSAFLASLIIIIPLKRNPALITSCMIIGINKKVIELIGHALVLNNISYREKYEDFDLLESNSRIITSLWSGIGITNIKIDPKEKYPILEKVLDSMKTSFEENRDSYNSFSMIFITFIGLLILCIGVGLFFLLRSGLS